jgi:glutathione S-transferase
VEYLNDQYNLDLLPRDPYERAKGKLVIDIINKKIIPAYFRTIQAQEPDKQAAGREEFTAALKEFAEKLPKNDGPFYGGKTFGFVDIELTPWVLRFVTEILELIGVDSISWKNIAAGRFPRLGSRGRGLVNGLMLSRNVTVFGKPDLKINITKRSPSDLALLM